MDDLMKCLYQFVLENRTGSLRDNPDYWESSFDAEVQRKRLQESLNQEQQKELDQLIDRLTIQNAITDEYIFHAALALARELNALVRA